jgi:hypothetical protein
MAFLKRKRKRKSKWGGGRKSTKFLAIEFATNDFKGATSIEDGGTRASAMLSMASNAMKCDKELTNAQRFSVALQKLRSSASVGCTNARALNLKKSPATPDFSNAGFAALFSSLVGRNMCRQQLP